MRAKRIGTSSRTFCRLILVSNLLLILSFSLTSSVLATYSTNPNPGSFETIEKTLNINEFINYEGDESILEDLKKAQCGGWDWEDSAYGKIPNVSGLPGRDGNYFGNVKSGMANRYDDGYIAPGDVDTCGFRSTCRPSGWEMYEDPLIPDPRYYPSFYKSFSCQRPLGGITPENQPDPEDENDPLRSRGYINFSCGGGQMPATGYICPRSPSGGPSYSIEGAVNGGLCGWLNNRWLYGYYQQIAPVDYACDDARITEKTILCDITLYWERSSLQGTESTRGGTK